MRSNYYQHYRKNDYKGIITSVCHKLDNLDQMDKFLERHKL